VAEEADVSSVATPVDGDVMTGLPPHPHGAYRFRSERA